MSRIQMTPVVKLVLYFLRFYLIFLLVLIIIKFVKVFHGGTPAGQ
jgi:hypothetical protein